ncbi:multidrug effflux MFS transporter [Microbacterium sp. LRZ72]|uniref:multidrug effflux MFS transporter n=1 Tax=Microbacterium sp. LRZ72 TaxID=2942481 RepID=UPI0029A17658|nr:multidrug effflux MFS transporter [Microbacterium sp. LRZ72]MDX2377327.1 multidrug effflux MFS transporter [Microbacterium sp. LRZ72]
MAGRRLTPALLTVLGFLAAVGPLAVDFFLPSFTDIATDLDVSASTVQLTLTGFLIGVAGGQLVLGPASDRFGRRPVLVVGMGLFALASIGLFFVPNIGVFIALRVVQGFGGAAGMVVARAVAVDLSTRSASVRPLSLIMMMVGLGPIIAPPIGGLLAGVWGWRGTIGAMAIFAVIMFVLALFAVPESLPKDQRTLGGGITVARSLGRLLRDAALRGYLIAFALGFGGLIAYVSASPFVAQVVLGMGPVGYSLSFAVAGTGMVLANLVNAWISPRVGPKRMLPVGQALALIAGVGVLVLALTGVLAIWSFIIFGFVLSAGTGLMLANATALALARADRARGGGSALLGASQFVLGAAFSPLVGLAGEDTAVPMAVIIVAGVSIGVVFAWHAGRVVARERPGADA